MSVKQMLHVPLGWNILETNRTIGGLFGYSSENRIVSLNVPSSNGVSFGLWTKSGQYLPNRVLNIAHPNMTAFHNIMLLSVGAPLTPAGGSS